MTDAISLLAAVIATIAGFGGLAWCVHHKYGGDPNEELLAACREALPILRAGGSHSVAAIVSDAISRAEGG